MPDMIVGWEQHLKNGNLWRGEVELAMQGGDTDEQLYLQCGGDVVSPTQELAQYIVTTMYPEYESVLCIDDEPIGTPPDFIHEPPKGYHYEVESFRRNVCRICIVNDGTFSYTDVHLSVSGDSKTTNKGRYSAPIITTSKQGDPVDISILVHILQCS